MSFVQRRRFLWILFLIGLALIGIVANATTLARLRFEDLVRQADAVARVRCLGSEPLWKNGEIWTETQFRVMEENKGPLPPIIVVQMPGGSLGHLHARVEEVPAFRPGEEAYVFLWGQPGQAFRVLGWSQGTFRIARDERTGVDSVTQDSAVTPIFDPATRQFRRGGVRNMPVVVFQLKLKRVLEKQNF